MFFSFDNQPLKPFSHFQAENTNLIVCLQANAVPSWFEKWKQAQNWLQPAETHRPSTRLCCVVLCFVKLRCIVVLFCVVSWGTWLAVTHRPPTRNQNAPNFLQIRITDSCLTIVPSNYCRDLFFQACPTLSCLFDVSSVSQKICPWSDLFCSVIYIHGTDAHSKELVQYVLS